MNPAVQMDRAVEAYDRIQGYGQGDAPQSVVAEIAVRQTDQEFRNDALIKLLGEDNELIYHYGTLLSHPSHSAAYIDARRAINKAIDARIERDVENGK